MTTGQDVGRVLHPVQVIGQIEGGIAQGVGLAVMEEIVLDGGLVRNPSFTDYLIPTIADMPDVLATCIEEPEPGAPFGAKGVGEPPTISSTPAIAAAIRPPPARRSPESRCTPGTSSSNPVVAGVAGRFARRPGPSDPPAPGDQRRPAGAVHVPAGARPHLRRLAVGDRRGTRRR